MIFTIDVSARTISFTVGRSSKDKYRRDMAKHNALRKQSDLKQKRTAAESMVKYKQLIAKLEERKEEKRRWGEERRSREFQEWRIYYFKDAMRYSGRGEKYPRNLVSKAKKYLTTEDKKQIEAKRIKTLNEMATNEVIYGQVVTEEEKKIYEERKKYNEKLKKKREEALKIKIEREANGIEAYEFTVFQIVNDKLILAIEEEISYTQGYTGPLSAENVPYVFNSSQRYVSGYTYFAVEINSTKGLFDGKSIKFDGKKIGTYSYTDTQGARRTVQKIKFLTYTE